MAGVFSSDPKEDPNAELIRSLKVNRATGELSIDSKCAGHTMSSLDVGESSHKHDVTGGLKVCCQYMPI